MYLLILLRPISSFLHETWPVLKSHMPIYGAARCTAHFRMHYLIIHPRLLQLLLLLLFQKSWRNPLLQLQLVERLMNLLFQLGRQFRLLLE